jgi:hypothetical protein
MMSQAIPFQRQRPLKRLDQPSTELACDGEVN